jgi:AcrR family transcriptional regulator
MTSEARERLLSTATAIFYSAGIHSVGVERIVAESKVTRATFYRHFPGKEDLVAAYLDAIHRAVRARTEQATAGDRPAGDILRTIGQQIVEEIHMPGFRGCAFINAAAEFPDAAHPVHQAVLAHREWFLTTVIDLFARAGHSSPEGAGRTFVMLRDGAMTAGCLGDPDPAGHTFLRGVDGLLQMR